MIDLYNIDYIVQDGEDMVRKKKKGVCSDGNGFHCVGESVFEIESYS